VLDDNLTKIFGEVTWKYNIDELINKLHSTLNELINRNDLSVKITELSNELLETLEIIEDCTNCKDNAEKCNLYGIHKLINKIENCLAELEKEEQGKNYELNNNELSKIDFELNKKVLCESCKEKKIEKLTDKYGNEEIARFLHECKLNAYHYYKGYIRWIPFDEFKNIEYLVKGGFSEVHKATWIGYGYYYLDVVLKRIYNNSSDDKVVNILKEVK